MCLGQQWVLVESPRPEYSVEEMSNIHQKEDLKALGEKAWKGVKAWKGEKALVGREVEFHSYKEGWSVMEF